LEEQIRTALVRPFSGTEVKLSMLDADGGKVITDMFGGSFYYTTFLVNHTVSHQVILLFEIILMPMVISIIYLSKIGIIIYIFMYNHFLYVTTVKLGAFYTNDPQDHHR
jgi:hypothetical protein